MNSKIRAEDLFQDPHLFVSKPPIHSKLYAKKIDKILGYGIERIEQKLLIKYQAYYKITDEKQRKGHFPGTQTWIGLHPQTLQTPYEDIYKSLTLLKDIKIRTIVDIGAAYGRVGILTSCIFPNAKFIGYEILKKRVAEGNRIFDMHNLVNCKILEVNVLEKDFEFVQADIYFIYDFSEPGHIEFALNNLIKNNLKHSFYLICRGDTVEDILEKKFKRHWEKSGFIKSGILKLFKFQLSSISEETTPCCK